MATKSIPELPEKDVARFWKKISEPDVNGDRVFTRSKNQHGYGTVWFGGRVQLAHRVAWQISVGPIPDGLQVHHNCPNGDNPACCNPDHLWLGTQIENIRDRDRKGRQCKGEARSKVMLKCAARGAASGSAKASVMGRHWNAKLNHDRAREIRSLFLAGGISQRELAARFGVSLELIRRTIKMELWVPAVLLSGGTP